MALFDRIIKGGLVVDGRNVPRFRADVAIRDGRVAEIGDISSTDASEVLDASGMIVAPGFVDLHTHYDAQVFWDPYCSLSGWHGVTSVVIGNCGFGFAPARDDDRDYLMSSLTRVEALPRACLDVSLPWTWRSFPEWMDALDRQPKGLNMLTYVPLNPMLIWAMGMQAKVRDANEGERNELCRLLDEAMQAGACGWSAQRTAPGSGIDVQRDVDGAPFATDIMSNDTALALAKVLSPYGHAFMQITMATADPLADQAHLEELAAVSNSSIIFNAIATDTRMPEWHRGAFAWLRRCHERGLKIYGQCQSVGEAGDFTFTFEHWNMYDDSPAWRELTLGTPEERLAKFRDPAARQRLKENPPFLFPLERLVILRPYAERFQKLRGGVLLTDAAKIFGYEDKVDLLVDLIVEDELKTLFQCPQVNTDQDLHAELVTEPYALWGVSDGGAHTKFLTTGAYPTEHLISFVRERDLLRLEEAHYRLSALPAHCAGFRGRGTLLEGAPADVVVYDFENLRLGDEEVAYDLPGGEWRRVRKADGYRYILVNGEVTQIDGEDTGATPGKLLRYGG